MFQHTGLHTLLLLGLSLLLPACTSSTAEPPATEPPLMVQADTLGVIEDPVAQSRAYMQEAMTAYQNQDYAVYLTKMQQSSELRKNHPTLIYNLASANALNNLQTEALHNLYHFAAMGLVADPAADDDFASIKDTDGFKGILERIKANQMPVQKSDVAFTLPEPDLIPESIAYDPVTDAFFIGSIYKRKIVQVQGGQVADFAQTAQDGLWSVFGMRVDSVRRHLWVTTGTIPQTPGIEASDQGKSAVLKYNIDTRSLVKRYDLPETGHGFNDLTLNSRGDLFISDHGDGGLYAILASTDRLQSFLAPGTFGSPEGIDFSEDGATLFVADYTNGIYKVDAASGSKVLLPYPDQVTILGIDGLIFYDNMLIGIQNGVRPQRVIRLHLDSSRERILKADYPEVNTPQYDEPTLGVRVNDTFYYIANSQWGHFERDGTLARDRLQPPVVLRLPLGGVRDEGLGAWPKR